jgi:endonuclease/exonuclease/phosphatase family metal-dependent hydrolase
MPNFRIATYNIHKGRGMDGRVRIERIVRVLREVEADIVTLQEVINHQERSSEDHQACYLAEQLGYFYSVAGHEPRGALRTDIRVGHEILHVFNVHLGTAVRERRAQARLIDEHLLKALDVPGHRIVMGDFNDWNHGLVTKTLSSEFHLTDLAAHLPRTRAYPALLPLVHLDHIYLDHELEIEKAHFHRNRLSLLASDHLPLVAEVAFREPR